MYAIILCHHMTHVRHHMTHANLRMCPHPQLCLTASLAAHRFPSSLEFGPFLKLPAGRFSIIWLCLAGVSPGLTSCRECHSCTTTCVWPVLAPLMFKILYICVGTEILQVL